MLLLGVCLWILTLIPFYVLLYRQIGNFEIANTSYKFYLRDHARYHNKFKLWFLFAVCALFAVAGVLIANISDNRLTGGLCAVFFGFCSFLIWYSIKVKDT
jgi:uncharacterized membrane protein